MSTLSEMRDRIADDLKRSDLDTRIDEAINRAIRHYGKEPFWFKETTGTLATVAGTASYGTADGLPSDIKRILYAEVTVSGTDYPLTERGIQWVQSMNPSQTRGQPSDYAWWRGKLFLYLVPDAVYTITLYYTKTYSDLALDADTNDWLTYAEDLIESRARWWIASRVISDSEEAMKAKSEENDALESLRSQNEDQASGQPIEPMRF